MSDGEPCSPLYPHDPYTDKQQVAIKEFLGIAGSLSLSPNLEAALKNDADVFAAKFLTARKWDVAKAKEMLEETSAFRLREELDTLPLFPSTVAIRGYDIEKLQEFQGRGTRTEGKLDTISNSLKGVYASVWHKHDKEGRPVYIERTGHTRVTEFVNRCKRMTPPGGDISEPVRFSHVHSNEVGGVLVRYQNETRPENSPKIVQCVVVMDCDGLGMGHLFGPAMELLKANTKLDQAYYPEGLHQLYVANAPPMISIAWSMIRVWLEPRVQKKVIFLKPHQTKEKLLEVIDAEHLPEYLGGTCKCEGGCVPDVDESVAPDSVGAATKEVSVGRGKSATEEVSVTAGQRVTWEFSVAKNDIQFSVLEKGSEKSISESVRAGDGSGTYTAEADGVLLFKMDNSFSWVHSKTVSIRITVEDKVSE